jgi:hypothetical protein
MSKHRTCQEVRTTGEFSQADPRALAAPWAPMASLRR